jgi:Uma2 family endonuclease
MPNVPENYLERWLRRRLEAYSDANPAVLNYVTPKGRVTVPGRPDLTEPEPDVAAYRDFPDDPIADGTAWDDVHPLIVAEVLVGNDPHKDLVRNVELYFQVPAIQEYWVLDGRDGDGKPSLLAHRRAADGWQVEVVPFGATYTTPTLPGFTLVIDPRA